MKALLGLRFIVLPKHDDHEQDAAFFALPPGPKMAWFMVASAAASAGDATRLPEAWGRKEATADGLGITVRDLEEVVRSGFLKAEGNDLIVVGVGRVVDRTEAGAEDTDGADL